MERGYLPKTLADSSQKRAQISNTKVSSVLPISVKARWRESSYEPPVQKQHPRDVH